MPRPDWCDRNIECAKRLFDGVSGLLGCDGGCNKISAVASELAGVIRACDVKRDARHFENFTPPRDQIKLAIFRGRAVFDVRGNAERDVVCAVFAKLHCVIARAACVGADHGAVAERFAGVAVGFCDLLRPRQMQTVGFYHAR